MPKLIVFDVGHGSCVLLQDGAVSTVIDCKNSTLLIDFLLSQNINTISQVIISHSDADHIDGILALIQSDYIQLGTVFVNADASKNSETWTDLRIALQDAVGRGKLHVRTEIGDGMADHLLHEAVQIEVVAPGIASRLAGPGGRTPQDGAATSNSMSVVLRLHHDNHPIMLIPGELRPPVQEDRLEQWRSLAPSLVAPRLPVILSSHANCEYKGRRPCDG